MSNHYHVVLHVDKQRAENWTKQEVVERWMQLFKGNMLILRWRKEAENERTKRTSIYFLTTPNN